MAASCTHTFSNLTSNSLWIANADATSSRLLLGSCRPLPVRHDDTGRDFDPVDIGIVVQEDTSTICRVINYNLISCDMMWNTDLCQIMWKQGH